MRALVVISFSHARAKDDKVGGEKRVLPVSSSGEAQ